MIRKRQPPSPLRERLEAALIAGFAGLCGAGLWYYMRGTDFVVMAALLGGIRAVLGFLFGPRAGHLLHW